MFNRKNKHKFSAELKAQAEATRASQESLVEINRRLEVLGRDIARAIHAAAASGTRRK